MSSRICHLTSVHARKDTRIWLKQCTSLTKHCEVHLVVADGKGDEVDRGIHVWDVGKRASRLQRMRQTTQQVFQKALQLDAQLYHFHDPELLPIGLRLKKAGKKVIYDAHEDVPRQIMGKPYLNRFVKPIVSKSFNWYEDRITRQLDGIITATPFIRERFAKLNPTSIDINNFPLLGELDTAIEWGNKTNAVCYVGGISEIRGLKEVVESFAFVKHKAQFLLAGKFQGKAFEEQVKGLDAWTKVKEYGMVNRTQMREILGQSLAGIVTFLPLPNHIDAQPNKMFEYMSAGIPVIGSDFPLWKNILEKNNCGICVNPLDPKAIAKAIDYLVENPKIAEQMGQNGRKAVLEKYNWKQEEQKLIQFYEKILSK